jgi:hypothetical protein
LAAKASPCLAAEFGKTIDRTAIFHGSAGGTIAGL